MKIDDLGIFGSETLRKYNFSNKVITVVGNSTLLPEDQTIIDKSACIIRFNNYGTREGIDKTADPLQCDILFSTLDLHSKGSKPKDVVIGIPFPFKMDRIPVMIDQWYPDSMIWMVNPYWNRMMCQELDIPSNGGEHPIPSVGFTALWHLNRLFSLSPDCDVVVYVCGFEWYYNEETGLFQNFDIRSDNYPKTWNHNYPKEIKWILNHLMEHENFVFGPRQIQLLGMAECMLQS